jgi:hypothetical protein
MKTTFHTICSYEVVLNINFGGDGNIFLCRKAELQFETGFFSDRAQNPGSNVGVHNVCGDSGGYE